MNNDYLRLSPSVFERIHDFLSSLIEFQTADTSSIMLGVALPPSSVGMYSLFSDKKLCILAIISLGCIRKSQLPGTENLEFELIIILIYLAKLYRKDSKYNDIIGFISELQGDDLEDDFEGVEY